MQQSKKAKFKNKNNKTIKVPVDWSYFAPFIEEPEQHTATAANSQLLGTQITNKRNKLKKKVCKNNDS